MAEETLWINTPVTGPLIDEFWTVKQFLGINAKADVVRFLIHEKAREIQENQVLVEVKEAQ